jgi:anti-sigma regulatory factor (Ser/Thr protein kinase)
MKRQLEASAILNWARKRKKPFGSADLVREFDVSRQTAARVLSQLVEDGSLAKTGSTRSATYELSAARSKHSRKTKALKLSKQLKGLAEDRVFEEVSLRLSLKSELSENAYRIAYYAFSEMLNNAIDHSESDRASIEVALDKGSFTFKIRDEGVGIFKKIQRGFKLHAPEEAIEHLLKGKQTTWPEAHSGQGIFFTSKIADVFEIRSEKQTLKFDNVRQDIKLSDTRLIKGTEVSFAVKMQTRRSLTALFESFANEDFEFDRTKYPIVVLQQTGAISRSQARRLMLGLEKFDRIILDFSKVTEIGQGFADEVFRVFQSSRPKLVIEVRNASASVNLMIRRAMAGITSNGKSETSG